MADQPTRTLTPVVAGVVAALVGFSSSFVVVVTGLTAVGVTPRQAASGLVALRLAAPAAPRQKVTSTVSTTPAVRPGPSWNFQYRLVWAITWSGGGAPYGVRSSVVWASPTSRVS